MHEALSALTDLASAIFVQFECLRSDQVNARGAWVGIAAGLGKGRTDAASLSTSI